MLNKLIVNEDKDLIEQGLINNRNARDIFVCTHGSRDVCCASFGFPIYTKLKNTFQKSDDTSTRVWRISHIGGHRYAPNVIEMPSGRVWSRFEVDDIEGIFEKQYTVGEVEPFYRGLIGLNTGYEQIMETILPTLGKERKETYSPFLPICSETGQVLEVPIIEFNKKSGKIIYENKNKKNYN